MNCENEAGNSLTADDVFFFIVRHIFVQCTIIIIIINYILFVRKGGERILHASSFFGHSNSDILLCIRDAEIYFEHHGRKCILYYVRLIPRLSLRVTAKTLSCRKNHQYVFRTQLTF